MDIDIPRLLLGLVAVTGAVWLLDVLWWKPARLRAASEAQTEPAAEPQIVEYARSFFPILLIVLLLRSFLAEPYQIPSPSMVPTLEVGDFIIVNKYAYGIRLPVVGTKVFDVGDPQRGDVMVFVPRHDPKYFIKRVIGLPGDSIRYQNKTLYINGERQGYEFVRQFNGPGRFESEDVPVREYIEQLGDVSHPIYRYPYPERPQEWQVPDGHYFVMGDNRGRSFDSRGWSQIRPEFGFVPDETVVGKAVAIWLHMPGWVPSFARNGGIR